MSTKNPAGGHYWWARMSDGRAGVFWTHPHYKEWHCCVATFRDSVRAESYTDDLNDEIEAGKLLPDWEEADRPPVDLVEPPAAPGPAAPRPEPPEQPVLRTRPGFARAPIPVRKPKHSVAPNGVLRPVYDKFTSEIGAWLAETKEITAAMVQERYKLNYNDALILLRAAAADDHGDWRQVRRNNQMGKVFVAKGTVPNEQAEDILAVLTDAADENRCVEIATAAIAARARVPLGDVTPILGVLMREGKVALARPQHGTSPAIYQVLAT